MAKKITMALELEDFMPDYEGMSFILFHSVEPNYAFVNDLNHLYDLSLARIDDLKLHNSEWPFFNYYDKLHQIKYYLIEMPASAQIALWPAGHKMLVAIGENASSHITLINDEFSSPAKNVAHDDIIAFEHENKLSAFRANFTTTAIIDPTASLPSTMTRRATKEYNDLYALIDDITSAIDMLKE